MMGTQHSGADPGFLIRGSTDLENGFGVTKKVSHLDFRGGTKWIFKGKTKTGSKKYGSDLHMAHIASSLKFCGQQH